MEREGGDAPGNKEMRNSVRTETRISRQCLRMLGVMVAAGLGHSTAAEEPVASVNNEVARMVEKSVDLRPLFRGYGLDTRAQGARGTCSVFAVTSAVELAAARKQGRAERLSVEFLNWAANKAADRYVDGGFFSELWTGYTTWGICPEDDMPYAARFHPSAKPSEQALRHARERQELGLQLHWIKPWDVKTGLTEREFSDIQQTLQRQWPVCGGFRRPIRERWQDGVLQMAPPEGVHDGHSVLLVGFRDDPAWPGGGVFLIRNSGGGPREAAISYEFVRTYMNDAVWIDEGPVNQ